LLEIFVGVPSVVIGFLGLIGAGIAFRFWSKTDAGEEVVDRWRLRTPVLGDIWIKYQVAQFARVLSTLLVGGIPLLQALEPDLAGAPVLLIDELDRTDEPFEAYLLEVLSDFQITIPEMGTIKAKEPPIVVITSNRTREIHDALKRRCFYYWVDYPDAKRELEILRIKAPTAAETLSRDVVAFVQKLRTADLFKLPGVAETIDWAHALTQLDVLALTPEAINDTLGVLLKYQDDIAKVQGSEATRILEQVRAELAAAS